MKVTMTEVLTGVSQPLQAQNLEM